MANEQINLERILDITDLDTALRKDKAQCEKAGSKLMWYHKNINRQCAEKILREAFQRLPSGERDGLFLVRDCPSQVTPFCLSFVYNSSPYHFLVQEVRRVMFTIDDLPPVHGLDQFIQRLQNPHGSPNGLPTRLTKKCEGGLPPVNVRKFGTTNLLHRAVKEKRVEIIDLILGHPLCPDINAKNNEGSTALHDAVGLGVDRIITSLLSHGADPKSTDSHGLTPLHKACEVNGTNAVIHLTIYDKACVQFRNPLTGEVALHEAARRGHAQCAKILLNSGAALFTRAENGLTPIELAETNKRKECIELLENFKEPPACTSKLDWYHADLDRQGAVNIFSTLNMSDGLFLTRLNRKRRGHILSVCYQGNIKHYEIRTKYYRNQCMYYIDNSPYHRSLEHLIEYFHCFEDGLEFPLKTSVSPSLQVKELLVSEIFANITQTSSTTNPTAPPKHLPKSKSPTRRREVESQPPRTKEGEEASPDYIKILPDDEEPERAQENRMEDQKIDSPKPKPRTRLDSLPPPTKEVLEASSDYISVEEEPQMVQEIRVEDLKIGVELEKGRFGSLMKGELTMKESPFKREAAIKILDSVWNLSHFKREISVRHALKNDYIVELLGVCYGYPIMLVEEMLPMGSVLEYLRDFPEHVSVERELYLWSDQIARGMLYLEEKRLVHRDLAAKNILLHSLQLVKIGEFGLSRAMGLDKDYYKASPGSYWPIKWYAPESILYNQFSNASDVWSFGVTLWEMFSYGMVPFDKMSGFEVMTLIQNEKRLEKPEKCPYTVYLVMNQCWSYKPEDRPTFTGLQKYFDGTPEYMSLLQSLRIKRDGK